MDRRFEQTFHIRRQNIIIIQEKKTKTTVRQHDTSIRTGQWESLTLPPVGRAAGTLNCHTSVRKGWNDPATLEKCLAVSYKTNKHNAYPVNQQFSPRYLPKEMKACQQRKGLYIPKLGTTQVSINSIWINTRGIFTKRMPLNNKRNHPPPI